ncbi:tetratricopeptide repeat protein, partial [Streptomyces sp. T-3]|nr:tetratricopeptide repeat protein [Streptomyces sp. T-3]
MAAPYPGHPAAIGVIFCQDAISGPSRRCVRPHSERVEEVEETQTRRFGGRPAAVAVLVVAAVAGGLLALGPDDVPRPAAPVIRADTVTGAGAPAPAQDLAALIDERRKALRTHPDDEASWTVLGTAYLEQARRTADPSYYPKSEEALRRSLRLRSAKDGNHAAMVGMGALANARHDFATARSWGERVRAAEPLRWTVYPVLIDAYTQLGAYEEATGAVQRLLDLRPGLAAFTRAGYELEMHGKAGEAKSALEQAAQVAASPAETSFCLHRIGELAWERGDVREALRQYEAALRADPDSHPALAAR